MRALVKPAFAVSPCFRRDRAYFLVLMRTLLAAIAAVLLASPVQAFCQPQPDNASTYNVENNTAQSLCLQNELAQQTALDAQEAKIDAMIGNMQIEAERQQQLMFDRLNQSLFGTPQY